VLTAAALRPREERRRALLGVALALGVAALAFLATNPYALLDHRAFVRDLKAQEAYNSRGLLLGERQRSGILYYLWTFTWGLGWAPALSAVGGAVALALRDRRVAALLVPTPVLFLVFMGLHGRYFGRYMLPAFPFACLLAAAGVGALVTAVARRRRALAPAVAALAAVALLAQPAIHSVHGSIVDSRTDTRTLARDWMLANIPRDTRLVQEPIVPREWLLAGGRPHGAPLWQRWLRTPKLVRQLARQFPGAGRRSDYQNYVRTLWPGLIDVYQRMGYCWVVSGSLQSARAALDPSRVPQAVAYYAALRRRARVAFQVSPYPPGATPERFQFDMSSDSYPLAYDRPGPIVTIYRLTGGRCAA
jgi:hypothetical protein